MHLFRHSVAAIGRQRISASWLSIVILGSCGGAGKDVTASTVDDSAVPPASSGDAGTDDRETDPRPGAVDGGLDQATAQAGTPDISGLSEADNSKSIYFPPLKLQGTLASMVFSCDWFACAYYQMTYTMNRLNGITATESGAYSPKFGFNTINNGNIFPLNMWFPDVYGFLERHGSPTLADVPYDMNTGEHYREWTTDPEIWKKALAARLESYVGADFNLDAVRQIVRDGEVLVVQFTPSLVHTATIRDFAGSDRDDPYVGQTIITSGGSGPDHTVAMVGYNDFLWTDLNGDGAVQKEELGAFKIAESVDDGTANNGFRWMSYNALRNPATTILCDNKVWRIKMRKNYQPKIVCQVVLNSARREKLKMQFGRSLTTNAVDALAQGEAYKFEPYGLGFKPGASGKSLIEGGDCAFDGGVAASDGGFTFDLTDLLAASNTAEYWYFRLANQGAKPVSIKSFQVIDLENNITTGLTSLPAPFASREEIVFLRYARPVTQP